MGTSVVDSAVSVEVMKKQTFQELSDAMTKFVLSYYYLEVVDTDDGQECLRAPSRSFRRRGVLWTRRRAAGTDARSP